MSADILQGSERYADGTYLGHHPTWHVEDSAWKASHVADILRGHGIRPRRECEVGCGAGEVLRQLREELGSDTSYVGFEISPDAHALSASRAAAGIEFRLGQPTTEPRQYDVLLLIDVIEHVPDYLGFLTSLSCLAEFTVLHVPLDLSAQMVARPGRLARNRATLGHLHYFDKDTALAAIRDSGYEVIGWRYTAGGLDRPPGSRLARLARVPRRAVARITPDGAARILGGYSLLVLAARQDPV
jgi:SAM-dependent methyltransferase